MAWTAPRTWTAGETVTATLLNAHIRDNFNVLKTYLDDSGAYVGTFNKPLAFRISSAVANVSTGETDFTGYTFPIPGGTLANGEDFHLRAWGLLTSNTNNKIIRLYVGAAKVALITTAASVVGNRWQIDVYVHRTDESTSKTRIFGLVTFGATTGAAPTVLHLAGGELDATVTWANANTVKLTGQGGASNDVYAYTAAAAIERLP